MSKWILALFVSLMLTHPSSTRADAGMVQSPNSHSGLNQYREGVILPNFDSVMVIGTHVEVKSDTNGISQMTLRRLLEKHAKNVSEQFPPAIQKANEEAISDAFGLPLVTEFSANTLVVRPSVLDFDIGKTQFGIRNNNDEIIVSIEVFDVIKGGVLAMASTRSEIDRETLYWDHGLREKEKLEESERIASLQTDMLLALFKDIKALYQKN